MKIASVLTGDVGQDAEGIQVTWRHCRQADSKPQQRLDLEQCGTAVALVHCADMMLGVKTAGNQSLMDRLCR